MGSKVIVLVVSFSFRLSIHPSTLTLSSLLLLTILPFHFITNPQAYIHHPRPNSRFLHFRLTIRSRLMIRLSLLLV